MKVLHTIWHLSQGGAQTYLLGLCNGLSEQGIDSVVVNLSNDAVLESVFEESGIPVKKVGMKSQVDLKSFPELFRVLKEVDADVVHCHNTMYLSYWALMLLGIPVVLTEHGGEFLNDGFRTYFFYRVWGRHLRMTISISHFMQDYLVNKFPFMSKRSRAIPNGIDLQWVDRHEPMNDDELTGLGLTPNVKRVGIVGRLAPQKDIELFIQTARELLRKQSDVEFVIVGTGDELARLRRAVHEYGIERNVFFLGYREDALRILKRLDVFLFTSSWEPFGLVLIEAMAAGVPVVSARVRGASDEIITHGMDGYVVPSRDPRELARTVGGLLVDDGKRNEMVERARKVVEGRYSLKRNVVEVAEVYRSVVNGIS